jgi:hypothetical protein
VSGELRSECPSYEDLQPEKVKEFMQSMRISSSRQSTALGLSSLICAGMSLASVSVATAQPAITIRVDTVSVSPDSAKVVIPIWLDNPDDTLKAFSVWFQFSRPDLLQFRFAGDTLYDTTYWNCVGGIWPNCIDSTLVPDPSQGFDFLIENTTVISDEPFDESGTLTSDWISTAVSLGGQGFDVKMLGTAGILMTAGIAPQTGGLLLKLVANLLPIPDTLSDRTADVLTVELSGHTSFSDPSGTSLTFQLFNGSVTILPAICCDTPGDADNDGSFNIADVTFGIARIFNAGPAPACQDEADANGDNSFNIADVTYGIARIFSSGPAPICGSSGS